MYKSVVPGFCKFVIAVFLAPKEKPTLHCVFVPQEKFKVTILSSTYFCVPGSEPPTQLLFDNSAGQS